MDEQTLNVAFTDGGEDVLAAAIERYGQPLLRYCHHVLCDYQEAQDAVQTTFIKAYDNRARFTPGTSLGSWLYKLAYRSCIDLLRQRRRQLFAPPNQTRCDPDYIGSDLRRALETLSAEERALVFGRVIEEQSYEELAERYDKPAATLRKRYERARKKLACALTEGHTKKEAII